MSTRATFHLLSFVAGFAGCFGLGVLGLLVHPVIAFLAVPYAALIGLLLGRIRCPNCGAHVGWQTYRIFGFLIRMRLPYIRKLCDHCGYDLSRDETRSRRQT